MINEYEVMEGHMYYTELRVCGTRLVLVGSLISWCKNASVQGHISYAKIWGICIGYVGYNIVFLL